MTQERARSLERALGRATIAVDEEATLPVSPSFFIARGLRSRGSFDLLERLPRPRLRREGDGGVRARRRGFCSLSSPLALGERMCATVRSAIGLSERSLAHKKEDEGLEKHTHPLPGAPDDGAWGSSLGDRAGPPLPVRPGALSEVLRPRSIWRMFAREQVHETRAM